MGACQSDHKLSDSIKSGRRTFVLHKGKIKYDEPNYLSDFIRYSLFIQSNDPSRDPNVSCPLNSHRF
jgi:ABC-type uncharacterized transport system ATPase component